MLHSSGTTPADTGVLMSYEARSARTVLAVPMLRERSPIGVLWPDTVATSPARTKHPDDAGLENLRWPHRQIRDARQEYYLELVKRSRHIVFDSDALGGIFLP